MYSYFSIYEINILLKTLHEVELVNQEVILHTKLRKWGLHAWAKKSGSYRNLFI
jgi:hypothetical protein